ncbi:unnamed protein product [Miscanthus lutarioriparius]|uniref:Uncharacterized protein n=1 Tax=Miscanthus lutarioriparius TaxID=422564 RepID=A0A811N9N4_9POAL|nr:unnamed protein product [Miscanthus lutarioriparius]
MERKTPRQPGSRRGGRNACRWRRPWAALRPGASSAWCAEAMGGGGSGGWFAAGRESGRYPAVGGHGSRAGACGGGAVRVTMGARWMRSITEQDPLCVGVAGVASPSGLLPIALPKGLLSPDDTVPLIELSCL